MPGYFNFFPTENYSNTIVSNIIAKVKFDESVQRNLAVFYPYTVTEGERPDLIAAKYYDDPTLDWLIYLANDITDPYYDWHMNQNQFADYINLKYGSSAKASEKIMYFRNNYLTDDTLLTTAGYQSLSYLTKKYYTPVLGLNDTIISYKRKQSDDVLETNKVISLTVTGNTSTFVVGERLVQGNTSAAVVSKQTGYLIVDKVIGAFTNTTATGSDSASSITVTSSNTLSQPISDVEAVYWETVDAYTYEQDFNDSKLHIRILDKSYVGKIEKDMRELFR